MCELDVINALHMIDQGEGLMNAIMCLTHPEQFDASVTVLNKIRLDQPSPSVAEALDHWCSLATGMSWMINRRSPAHRDKSGFRAGYDYLSVWGDAKAQLQVEDLGLTVNYRRGCVVAIAGRTFTHAVEDWGTKDPRTCIARWIRKSVFQEYGVSDLPWATVKAVEQRLYM
jgi:hypothetical protein